MSEIDDLRKELQELKTQVSTVSRRLTELDSTMSDHIGLDWGETLTDANSPHPNMSVNTLESGGGAIRQDQYGMQVSTGGTARAAIYFVDELEPDPSSADPVQVSISGRANDGNGQSLLSMQAIDLDPPTAPVAAGQIYVTTTGSDVGRAGILVYVDSDLTGTGEWSEVILNRVDGEAAGTLQLYKTLLRLVPSQAANYPFTSDPANAIEGDIWYNTTDDQFKFYEGGTIKTLGGGGMPTPITMGPQSLLAIGSQIAANATAAASSATFPASNRAILYPFDITEDITVTQLWSYNGATASGNIDVGIYDSAFGRVVSSGTTAQSGTNSLQVFNITDTPLTAGQYYMAVAMDNTTGTLFRQSFAANHMRAAGCFQMASAFVLPSTITPAAVATAHLPMVGWTRKATI